MSAFTCRGWYCTRQKTLLCPLYLPEVRRVHQAKVVTGFKIEMGCQATAQVTGGQVEAPSSSLVAALPWSLRLPWVLKVPTFLVITNRPFKSRVRWIGLVLLLIPDLRIGYEVENLALEHTKSDP